MAKWKVPTTEVTTTDVDPRTRMKEIRAEVASYLKDNPRGLSNLGELPKNMEDACRVIIATQDLLDVEKDKHQKATSHICEMKTIIADLTENEEEMEAIIEQREAQINALHFHMSHQHEEIQSLSKRCEQYRAERDAVLTTMKLQANMETPAPVIMSNNSAESPRRGTVTGRLR